MRAERLKAGDLDPDDFEDDGATGPYSPDDIGRDWNASPEGKTNGNGHANGEKFYRVETQEPPPRKITATPYVPQDPKKIPRRQCLYADHYYRKFVSTTVAPGGRGKSSLCWSS